MMMNKMCNNEAKEGKRPAKPMNWKDAKRFVRYAEGAEMYSMSLSKFQELARDACACYKIKQLVLVNLDIFEEFLETYRIVEDGFYK